MNKIVYKLTREEWIQALADYLSKKYDIDEKFAAWAEIQIDEKTGAVIIEAKRLGGVE